MPEFRALSAATGEPVGPAFPVHGPAEVDAACAAAAEAFAAYRATGREERAAFLETVAEQILAIGDPLIEAAMRESGLPRGRLEGERGRTVGQLRMFAGVVRAGAWQQLRIDPALPDRQPLPRPDLRLRMIPVGPVAVFGASNFPLAFSTAGGDTASALAAGCPVVVKGHPAHPETGALVAEAIARAVAACGLPKGVFGHLTGPSNELGAALVQDPRIAAVGFTGSRAGGLALVRLAQARSVPIPVYAEMSSINPVILMPGALAARGRALAEGFVQSLTMGAGQFCTNPGLVIAVEGADLDAFVAAAAEVMQGSAPQTMLSPSIHDNFAKGVSALAGHAAVETIARGQSETGANQAVAALFQTSAQQFLADAALGHEVFGSSSVIVRCQDLDEVGKVIASLEGQLTATLQLDDGDVEAARTLLPVLADRVGRVLANGWPTGVEVAHAMVHGGPFPATSDGRTTSVGTLAIHRFLRPVAFQNLPAALLPAGIADENPWGVARRVDGVREGSPR